MVVSDRRAISEVDHHEAATAEVAGRWVGDRQGETDCNGGIDRIATTAQDLGAYLGSRQRSTGDDTVRTGYCLARNRKSRRRQRDDERDDKSDDRGQRAAALTGGCAIHARIVVAAPRAHNPGRQRFNVDATRSAANLEAIVVDCSTQTANSRDLQRLRRIAFDCQGLLRSAPFGRGLAGARKALEHLSYVQIDTISVIERAHHHVWFSRVPGYHPDLPNKLLARRQAFEYWFHAAAYLPINDYRFALPRMLRFRSGDKAYSKNRKVQRYVLDRIRAEGPLLARDFESDGHKGGTWWDWKPAKKALEHLFQSGELMVVRRDGFQKRFDLAERFLPSTVDTSPPTAQEWAEHLLDAHLRAHGAVTPKTVTYLRESPTLRSALADDLKRRCSSGELVELRVDGGAPFYARTDMMAARLPAARKRVRLLSPFDNAVIHRHRLSSLWGFDYQIECYVPRPKRKFGYFCLPILYGDQFVGRVDCKAERPGDLLVQSLHIEPDFDSGKPEGFQEALDDALAQLAAFNGCDGWRPA